MKYEVEMKFPVSDHGARRNAAGRVGGNHLRGPRGVRRLLCPSGPRFRPHRRSAAGGRKGRANFLTYKGPKVDATTKTRHEIDLPLPPEEETAQAWIGLLTALGFTVAGEVRKSRRKAHVAWQGRRVEVSLDEVEGLGTFVELELVVGPAEAEAAKTCIAALAERLQLEGSVRRSYLELLHPSLGAT